MDSLINVTKAFYSYADLVAEIKKICSLITCDHKIISLAQTPEGRDLWAIHVRPQGWNTRLPTVWIDANMHAAELVGTNVVLAQLCYLAKGLTSAPQKYSHCNYIFIPRMCPDGAERFFDDGRHCRSNPRESRPLCTLGPRWDRQNLVTKPRREVPGFAVFQNPQRIGVMRKLSPYGAWTYDEHYKDLLRRREPEDTGPFYHIYPEGVISNFDGSRVPSNSVTLDNEVDLNRNFPTEWVAESGPETRSGRYALSEVESAAVTQHFSAHPEIYFCMNYHTCGGVFIRPPSALPDTSLPRIDHSSYAFFDKRLTGLTGYPAVSGAAEFQYLPGVPLPGTWTSYTYHSRGAFSYVCELWDLPRQVGRTDRPFIDCYTCWNKETWRRFYEFDEAHYKKAIFGCTWQPFEHPQLGLVEVGEYPIFVTSNPPPHFIERIVQPQLDVFDLLVSVGPRPDVTAETVHQKVKGTQGTADASYFLKITLGNKGFLPTFVSKEGERYFGNPPVTIVIKNQRTQWTKIIHGNELGGYAPPNTGWIDFPAVGVCHQQEQSHLIPLDHNTTPDDALDITVQFARSGTLKTTSIVRQSS